MPYAKVPSLVWGKTQGWVSVPALWNGKWYEQWYEWPNDKELIFAWIKEANKEASVYWSPLVFPKATRKSAHETTSLWAWADLDDVDLRKIKPKPTLLWASSPGRYQSLYRLNKAVDAKTLEEVNQRIAHASKADPSGWDAGQVLRVPGTINHKYDDKPRGKMYKPTRAVYRLTALRRLPLPQQYRNGEISVKEEDFTAVLSKWQDVIPMEAWHLLEESHVEKGERSTKLWSLIRSLAESGLPASAIFSLAKGSSMNKFRGRSDEDERLRREVAKAIYRFSPFINDKGPQVSAQHPQPLSVTTQEEASNSRGERVDRLQYSLADSWLSRYVEMSREYARDAPEPYHLACGLALLSATVGHYVQLSPNLFSDFHPALFVLLVGPSRAGKSRAMKVAHTVLRKAEIGVGVVDSFTPEGIISELSENPAHQAWWKGEEISGAIKQATRGGYMSNLFELLMHLFDTSTSGEPYTRRLSKETVRLNKAHLTLLGATTPENYAASLGSDSIHTGFLPRFLQVYDPNPPLPEYEIGSHYVTGLVVDEIAEELRSIREWLREAPQKTTTVRYGSQIFSVQHPKIDLWMKPSTWEEWRRWQMQNDRRARETPEIAPILKELGPNALKVAMLMTVARKPEIYMGGAEITHGDMLAAIEMVRRETNKNHKLYSILGTGQFERNLQRVAGFIKEQKRVTRTEVGQKFGSTLGNKRDLDQYEATLVDRGMIDVEIVTGKNGRPRKEYVWKSGEVDS